MFLAAWVECVNTAEFSKIYWQFNTNDQMTEQWGSDDFSFIPWNALKWEENQLLQSFLHQLVYEKSKG